MSLLPSKQNLLLLLALASLVLVHAVNFYSDREAADALRWRKHTHEALLAISEVNERKDQTESLVREFVVTGSEPLALRAEKNFAEIHQRLAHARQLLGDNPNQVRRLDQLDATRKELIARWVTTLATRRTQGKDAAEQLVSEGIGRRLSDAAEFILDEMATEENRLLAERSTRAERFSTVSSVATQACGGLTVVFGFFAWRALRAANSAVRSSEESLAITLQSIGDGVLATDGEGRITRLNPVAEALTGWTQAEAAGHPVAEVFNIINETTRQPAFLPVADTLAKGTIHGLANHTILLARGGTERPIEDSCAPIRNRAGEVVGAVLVFRDVTEEHRLAQQLAAIRRHDELLFSSVADGMHEVDLTGTIIFENLAAERMLGYAKGELIGRPAHVTIHHHHADSTEYPVEQCPIYATLRDGETRNVRDEVFWRKDGTRFAVEYVVSSINDEQGRRIGAIVAFRDVTERRQQEEAVRGSQRQLESALRANQLIMEHSLDVICTIDGQGRFDFVSAACAKLWGYQPEELVGRPYIDLIHPEDHPASLQAAAAVMAGRPVLNFENRYRRKDGTLVPVMWSASWSAVEQRMFCVAHDVTERKRVEAVLRQAHQELSNANAELDRASRHKDEFLANMSHELRTPLNAILGMSELLTEQLFGPLTPRQAKSVSTIASSGRHLLDLINDILDLSKIEAGKMELHAESVKVDELCQSCLAFVRTQAMQKQVYVDHQREPRPFALSADPKRLKQILVNLLTNAVKFTPQGGSIGLTMTAPEGEDVVRFTVWDTGIGIAAADQARLFRAFTQVDSGLNRTQEGTGLGLSLVAKLVELHGGSVVLESEPGQGSRFIVTLPLTSPGLPPPAPEPAAATVETSHFRRAMVIEDDPPAAEQLERYLGELDLSSVVHPRGEGVLEAALRERPDVILLDIQLPNESGWVALAKLKEHPQTRNIPVAVVSVVDEPGKARAMGAAAHLTKPVSREQLATFLHRPFSPKAEAPPTPVLTAPASGPTILLAEDNESNIATLGSYLTAKGYAMHFALNGLIAVKLARELRPALILMDIQMPMMDGLTATRELRADAAFKDVPIIALTALAMAGDRERCIAAGATEYMSKPVKLKELAALVEKLLGKRDA